ncbi:flavodoxin family protein [Candidatus Omnitrophota bacterium]
MNVITILGSPQKSGSTATVLGWVENELEANGHHIDRVNIMKSGITNGCLGCYACKKSELYECIQKDDANEIFRKMTSSDVIILSSPLYCWGFSAQLKALIDRMISQVKGYGTPEHRSSLEGKPLALVVTCADGIENNADILVQGFNNMAEYFKSSSALNLVIPGCSPGNPPDENARKQAREFAQTLLTSIT